MERPEVSPGSIKGMRTGACLFRMNTDLATQALVLHKQ
jgi:hypothetical protein